MLGHELSCQKGRLLLSVLMLKDAGCNHYSVPGVDKVVSNESRHLADDGHKVLCHLRHLLRVSHALEAPHCNVHSFSLPPLKRGGTRRPRLELINVPSVKGYKGWRNFLEIVFYALGCIGLLRLSNGALLRRGSERA